MTNEEHQKWYDEKQPTYESDQCEFCGLYGLRWKEFPSDIPLRQPRWRLALVSGEPHVCQQYRDEMRKARESQRMG